MSQNHSVSVASQQVAEPINPSVERTEMGVRDGVVKRSSLMPQGKPLEEVRADKQGSFSLGDYSDARSTPSLNQGEGSSQENVYQWAEVPEHKRDPSENIPERFLAEKHESMKQ